MNQDLDKVLTNSLQNKLSRPTNVS